MNGWVIENTTTKLQLLFLYTKVFSYSSLFLCVLIVCVVLLMCGIFIDGSTATRIGQTKQRKTENKQNEMKTWGEEGEGGERDGGRERVRRILLDKRKLELVHDVL